MGRLILQEFMTADGLAAGPQGSTDFIPAALADDDRFQENQLAFLGTVDTMVLGRRTYELFAGYWPTATEEGEFAEQLNSLSKVVFSNTLERAPWGDRDEALVEPRAPSEAIPGLKESAGKDLVVWGSLDLAGSLVGDGLVDELQLWLLPVVLGDGRRLFSEGVDSFGLDLLEARPSGRGAVLLRYAPR